MFGDNRSFHRSREVNKFIVGEGFPLPPFVLFNPFATAAASHRPTEYGENRSFHHNRKIINFWYAVIPLKSFLIAVSKVADKSCAVAPIFLDLYPKIEIDLCAKPLFKLLTGIASDKLERRSALANDDSLVRCLFAEYLGSDADKRALVLEFLNYYRRSVRNLLVKRSG